ncbi:MAG: DNA primase [Candidatus Ancillula sp.]|jgi:DNA primase|nr:DNA primase [Candidatus Ancillula sp.]
MSRIAPKEDIERLRDLVSITDIVSQFVTLKNAGVGAAKGLCPFHDEKTPSFTVRESTGTFHCFGCGEGGDVFTFIMKINGVDFPESLEIVAQKIGYSISYKEVFERARSDKDTQITRSRVLLANKRASGYFFSQFQSTEAQTAREMMYNRKFTDEDCARFGVGYAPRGSNNLVQYMQDAGFTRPELEAAGLVTITARGILDRFQGRLIWPIRDTAGDILGFGARKLYDDDFFDAKYLNTSETRVYKKSSVLYGVDLARKQIGKTHSCVIVEGYTDVMAMHLAGIDTAVATCGTSFGSDHVKIIRRLMGDTDYSASLSTTSSFQKRSGKVIFTFDGDEAGLNAAMKAFSGDQSFVTQTYIAIVPGGMDPCDLRIQNGNLALKNLVDAAIPMFEFAIQVVIQDHDITTSEGRVGATRSAALIIATIKDRALRPEYARILAGKVGVPIKTVQEEIKAAMHILQSNSLQAAVDQQIQLRPKKQQSDLRTLVSSQLLSLVLQFPQKVDADKFLELESDYFVNPFLRKIFSRIVELGGVDIGKSLKSKAWIDLIGEDFDQNERNLLIRLSTFLVPIAQDNQVPTLSDELIDKIIEYALSSRTTDIKQEIRALKVTNADYREKFKKLMDLELMIKSRSQK